MNTNEPLEEAYTRLRSKLRAIARSYNLPGEDVADALHESYLRLHGTAMPSTEAAAGSMAVTLRNLILDFIRKVRRRKNLPLEEALQIHTSESSKLGADDIIDEMRRTLSSLQFQIMTMLAVEELDYPEIAVRLGMTEGAVRTNVSRARKILREHFSYE